MEKEDSFQASLSSNGEAKTEGAEGSGQSGHRTAGAEPLPDAHLARTRPSHRKLDPLDATIAGEPRLLAVGCIN